VVSRVVGKTDTLRTHNQDWSKAHREKHKEIFDHLREVNQLCHQYLWEHQVDSKSDREVFATVYFARGLTCFQSIVALAERGFIDDVHLQRSPGDHPPCGFG
jgi:hypothetical protein